MQHHTSSRGPRIEDEIFVRGMGRFAADTTIPNQAAAYFVRSPMAAADVISVDIRQARSAPGVLGVFTAADMAAAGGANVTEHPPMVSRDGTSIVLPARPALAGERVTHVGEAIVLIVAETYAQAEDAAELVSVEYREQEAVVDVRKALLAGQPQVWPDARSNIALDWAGLAADPEKNAAIVDEIIKSAAYVARLHVSHQRLICNSLEPRGATASFDPVTGTYYLKACSQGARTLRDAVATVMGLPKDKLRVVTDDVGGAFGFKVGVYPEYVAILIAARKLGRPVHWMSKRTEAFLSDSQGRDSYTEGELALDGQGKFLALRVNHTANLGAYVATVAAKAQTENLARCLPGCYDIKFVDAQAKCVFTNTVPTAPYRGAGRPEANYILERLVDEAARISGIDRVKLRRMNMISPQAMPYKTSVGTTYDTGDFEAILDRALAEADYAGFEARRKHARSKGVYRGIGLCCALEHSGATPVEGMWIDFPTDNRLQIRANVHSTGQGHRTVFSRIVADRLGIPLESVEYVQGDSAHEIAGYSAVGSRSAMHLSHGIDVAVTHILEKATRAAALEFECAPGDIAFEAGQFRVLGTDRTADFFSIVRKAAELTKSGQLDESLSTKVSTETGLTFPNGCHIAEVEIDPRTGILSLISYVSVDDCGHVLDPTIVEGQSHGAIVQGLGQALHEIAVYDARGQLLTASYLDYTMPRADHIPTIKHLLHSVPARTNPYGVKGAGEAGTVAAIAAVMNAIVDAIPGDAARRIEMPATQEKLWRACRQAAAV
jgi:carbon-monoxide dehydrogenase large subunit